jgi:hypothetical protein
MSDIGPNGLIRPIFLIFAVLLAGCSSSAPNNSNTTTTTAASTPASPSPSPLTGFEKDLQYIRNGQFTYVWVFSRKDGKPLQPDDSAYLRTNAPQVVDWVTTDEGRKVIAGTNFNLEEGNLEALKKRYIAEDYTGK